MTKKIGNGKDVDAAVLNELYYSVTRNETKNFTEGRSGQYWKSSWKFVLKRCETGALSMVFDTAQDVGLEPFLVLFSGNLI